MNYDYGFINSVREIKVIIGRIVILSHSPTSDDDPEDERYPDHSQYFSIETVDDQPIPNIFLWTSVHEPEVEILVAG